MYLLAWIYRKKSKDKNWVLTHVSINNNSNKRKHKVKNNKGRIFWKFLAVLWTACALLLKYVKNNLKLV